MYLFKIMTAYVKQRNRSPPILSFKVICIKKSIMRIALFISGRATKYEVGLLPFLKKCKYDVDLFMSLNDTECDYYTIMREDLKPYLKKLQINVWS